MTQLVRILSVLICFCFSPQGYGQEDSLLQSLGVYEKLNTKTVIKADTILLSYLEQPIKDLTYTDPKKSEYYAFYYYRLAQLMNDKKGIAKGLRYIGDAKMLVGEDIDSAQYYVNKSLEYSRINNLAFEEMKAYYSAGNAAFYKSNFEEALKNYFKVEKIAREKYPKESGAAANGIGLIYRVISNNEKSKEYFEEALRLGKLYKDTADQTQAYNNLGIIAKNEEDFDAAFDYYDKGLILAKESNNIRRLGEIYYNLSVLYQKTGNIDKTLEFMEKSTEVTALIGGGRGKALDYYNLGYFYMEQKKYREAEPKMQLALEYGEKSDYLELVIEAANSLANISANLKKYRDAYYYQNLAYVRKDSMNLIEANHTAREIENQIELEKRAVQDSLQKVQHQLERQHQKKLNEEKLKSRDILLWTSGIIIILIIVVLYFVFRSRRELQKKNKIISDRNIQIVLQKEEIEEQHKEITDSINYAKRIQSALISGNEEWDKISMDHFIFFKPKDVVSGDFYWAYHDENEEISIWVTADCTGHGVPGAFMSMLGISFLNEIVVENNHRKGGEVLQLLRSKIIQVLSQKGGSQQQRDGMDLALCIWDKRSNQLEFTGANNPLWIIRKTASEEEALFKTTVHGNGFSLIELPANKMPVGIYNDVNETEFSSQLIDLKKDDLIISFTDGYADQFGGEKGKKMKYKPFKTILLELQDKPVKMQGLILSQKFDAWKGDLEQIDDVCVIGVRI
ncbi:MAG: SpoIIE family protein phosphatase [Crocinitomicaceae bacterium]